MKRLIYCFLMLIIMLILFGCEQKTAKVNEESDSTSVKETDIASDAPVQEVTFKRVKTVTLHRNDEESQSYEITWNVESCSFHTEGDAEVSVSIENNILTYHFKDKEDDISIDMLAFDEQGCVSAVCPFNLGEDEWRDVSYDENGWPQGELTEKFEMNVSELKYSYNYMAGHMQDYTVRKSKVITLGQFNNAAKVDLLEIKEYHSGDKEETLEDNYETLTYDEFGNLLKYSTRNWTIEYTYSNESIRHNWERLAPFLCALDLDDDFFADVIVITPLFWNIR